MILGQQRAFLPLYIAPSAKWRSGQVLPMPYSLTDSLTWLTTLKDRATQLIIKYKSGALITQCERRWGFMSHRKGDDLVKEHHGRHVEVKHKILKVWYNEISRYIWRCSDIFEDIQIVSSHLVNLVSWYDCKNAKCCAWLVTCWFWNDH